MNHISPLTQPVLCLRRWEGSDIVHPLSVHSGRRIGKLPVLGCSGKACEEASVGQELRVQRGKHRSQNREFS